MTDISGHLGNPGAVSRDDAMFSGEILRLDVNSRPKISRRPKMSRRLPAPGCPRMTFSFSYRAGLQRPPTEQRESLLSRLYARMISSFLLKFKMADGEYCRATNVLLKKLLFALRVYTLFFL